MSHRDYSPYSDEEAAIRAEVGECTAAADHEVLFGMCAHCGAEFDSGVLDEPSGEVLEPSPDEAQHQQGEHSSQQEDETSH